MSVRRCPASSPINIMATLSHTQPANHRHIPPWHGIEEQKSAHHSQLKEQKSTICLIPRDRHNIPLPRPAIRHRANPLISCASQVGNPSSPLTHRMRIWQWRRWTGGRKQSVLASPRRTKRGVHNARPSHLQSPVISSSSESAVQSSRERSAPVK
jgi:hypothetical protein